MIRVFRVSPTEAFREARNRLPDLAARDLPALLEIVEKAERDAPQDRELRTLRLALETLDPREAADVLILHGGLMWRTMRAVSKVLDGAA